MRRLRAITLLAAIVTLAQVAMPAFASPQGTWESLAPVPSIGDGVEAMAVGQVGDRIIAAYGLDNGWGTTTTTRIFDISHDTWTTGAPGPFPEREQATAVTWGGNLYVLGGGSLWWGKVLNKLDRYRPATNTWVRLAVMPTARAGLAAAVVGHSIYAIGGRRISGGPCLGGELATVERYDIDTGTWSAVASLPTARSDLAAMAVGGKIFVFGGCTADFHWLSDVDVYDPVANTWSTAPADMPTARGAFYQVGRVGDRIYVIGGWGGQDVLGTNEVYRVSKDSWGTSAPMLTPRASMGVVSVGGRIYTVGGAFPAWGVSSRANEVFKP